MSIRFRFLSALIAAGIIAAFLTAVVDGKIAFTSSTEIITSQRTDDLISKRAQMKNAVETYFTNIEGQLITLSLLLMPLEVL